MVIYEIAILTAVNYLLPNSKVLNYSCFAGFRIMALYPDSDAKASPYFAFRRSATCGVPKSAETPAWAIKLFLIFNF